MSGPTQNAALHEQVANRWDGKPRLARALRILIVVLPVALSFVFSWTAARAFPPERLGLGLWVWWGLLVAASVVVMRLLRRLAQKLAPLAVMLQLTLIFPDEAPSRMRTALRSGNSKSMLRQLEDGGSPEGEDAPATEVLLSMLKELNSHDPLTRGHSERVRAYTDLIAEQLELDEVDAGKLRWGALLHDLGKLEVPSEILNSKGRPSEEEWQVLKSHPEHSGRILEPLKPWLGEWALAGEQHHLRWDGKGYPSDLAGTDISLAGRIVAVADAYDVMTSVRSYKKGLPPEVARRELADCAGTQFDPMVVRAFLTVGIGRLRAVLGPLGWFAGVLDALRLPFAPAAVANAAASAAAAVAVAAGATAGIVDQSAEETTPAPPVAREVMAAPPLVTLVTDEDVSAAFQIQLDIAVGSITHTQPANGELVVVNRESGEFLYVPDPDFSGSDRVVVTTCVENDCTETVVQIGITPVNDPPTSGDDEAAGAADTPLSVPVLENDVDVDDDTLTVVIENQPANGTVTTDGTSIVYLPDPGFFGVDVVEYVVIDESGGRSVATVVVTISEPEPGPVTPAPRAPTAIDDAATVLEDGTTVISVLANDVEGDAPLGSSVEIVTPPTRGLAIVLPSGNVFFDPDDDIAGTDGFSYRVVDTGGVASDPAFVSVAIVSVNDAPGFTAGPSVLAHLGDPSLVMPWATEIAAGPPDESGQTVTFAVVADRPELFAVAPTIDPATGELSFTPSATSSGTTLVTVVAVDDGGTGNGGVDVSPPAVFTLRVNERPSAEPDVLVVLEEGAATVDVLANDTDAEDGTPLGAVVVGFASKGVVIVNPDRTITYTPTPGLNGDDVFLYAVTDGDGATSALTTVAVSIIPVNDAPSFVDAGDPAAVLEDAGAQTVAGWASSIDPGAVNESGQSLSFVVTANSNPGLFAVAPAVDEVSGDLTFTPAADANGVASIDLTLSDDGGTANGGLDTSATSTFTITVTAVNDAPSFVDAGDPAAVLEDAGAQTVAGWASSIDPGAVNESGQSLSFVVTANSNPGLFAVAPAVDEVSGDLTFTPAADANGVASIDLTLSDDGGTANGGLDASAATSVQIIVTAVNDEPTFTGGAHVTVAQDSGVYSLVGWATAMSAGPADESGQTLTFTEVNSNNPLFSLQPKVDETTGELTFTPTAGVSGTADVDVTLSDDGGVLNGGDDTSVTFSFQITVTPSGEDFDGIAAGSDNCPGVFNIEQLDTDGDGTGDACDATPTLASTATYTDTAQALGFAQSMAVALGDLDGDGDLDVVAANRNDDSAVWMNDGVGGFTDSGQALAAEKAEGVAVGDLDGDGDLDIAFAHNDDRANTVWFNNGVGVFTDSGQTLGDRKSTDLVLGDVDGDGDLDIAVANRDEGNTVWLNDGVGGFATSGQAMASNKTYGVAIGDLDGDADLDLFFANESDPDTVWLNNGSGVFINSGQALSADRSAAAGLVDVDGDGDLDAVVAADSDPTTIWLNDGAGVMTDSGQALLPGGKNRTVVAGDLDGDGDSDLVLGDDGDENTVWMNDGLGVFSDSGQLLGTSNSESTALGDLDGDGDLDLVVGNDGEANRVYRNG